MDLLVLFLCGINLMRSVLYFVYLSLFNVTAVEERVNDCDMG